MENKKQIKEFEVEAYQWEMDNFSSNKNVGPIENAKIAVQKAKQLWIDEFSTFNNQSYNPINGRKIEVSYDADNECWLINGTLSSRTKGSVPYAIIEKEGKVLAVWMG